jgi:DNA-binding NarL/FixJ family response regulator
MVPVGHVDILYFSLLLTPRRFMQLNICASCQAALHTSKIKGIAAHLKLLTLREHDLLPLILAGYSNAELADKIGIAKATVKIHRHHIYKKMNVNSLMGLMNQFEVGPGHALLDLLNSFKASKKYAVTI